MWQEDFDELVRLVGELPDVKVRVVADDNTATDLPQLRPRLAYFTVTGLCGTLACHIQPTCPELDLTLVWVFASSAESHG